MTYKTIRLTSEGAYREKGSRFLAFAFPVKSVDEVTVQLKALRKTYHDARHHCYGYIIGMEQQSWRANDDGEPGHSAGDPILGQIRSHGLTNTLIVVVRYFGGTKLGVSGLIHAYKTAAQEALKVAEIIKIYPSSVMSFSYSYAQTNLIEHLADKYAPEVISRAFAEECQVRWKLRKDVLKEVQKTLHNNGIVWDVSESE